MRLPPTKENAPCCVSRRDSEGRLPIGFCGPNCLRRPRRWAALLEMANTNREVRDALESISS